MDKTIYVTEGAARYVGGTITETAGKNIAAAPIVVALGPYTPPPAKTAAVAPDIDAPGSGASERVVKYLVDSSDAVAEQRYLWAWVTDQTEIEPIRLDGPFNIR